MQIQVIDGYITGYATTGSFPDGIEVSEELIASLEPEKIGFYRYENGKAVFDSEKWEQAQAARQDSPYIPSVQQSTEAVSRMMLSQLSLEDNDTRLQVSGLYPFWAPGNHKSGDIRNAGDQTWECFQDHDNAVYPDIKPGSPAWFTFWRPLHGKSPETARPFVPVQGAHDMYRAGEYMIWTDGTIQKCKQDTNYSPADYPQAWEVVEG